MAVIDYPHAFNGSFTTPTTDILIQKATIIANSTRYNATGAGTGASSNDNAHLAPVWEIGAMPTTDIVASGVVYNQSSASTYGLSQSSTFATPLFAMVVQRYRIRKVWKLIDVTTSGNASKRWSWGFPVTQGYVEGFAADSTPTGDFDLAADVEQGAIQFDLDRVGTFHGTARLGSKRMVTNFRDGGPTLTHYDFNFSGDALGNYAIDTAYRDIFENTATVAWAGDPPYGALVMDVGASSGTLTENVLCYDVTIGADMANGGPEVVQARFRVDA